MLPKRDFNSVIRAILTGPQSRAASFRGASFRNLKRLGIARNLSKAHVKVPEGSDQIDVGSIVTWMDNIQPEHKRSIWQLIEIDATAVSRT